jgi:GNAT superfamily N-acetyltransferase
VIIKLLRAHDRAPGSPAAVLSFLITLAVKLRAARVELRVMTTADLDRVDPLMMVAYKAPSRRAELGLYLAAQPDGWFVLDDGGEVAAAGGAVAYGAFCWVGLIATDPARRRQGLATTLSKHLMDWAHQQGCTTIALDASDAGRPVYEPLGFQTVGLTRELLVPPTAGAGGQDGAGLLTAADLDEVLALDAPVFGGDRGALLRAIAAGDSVACYGARDGNELAGYLFAGSRLLGPGCAADARTAVALVRAATRDGIPRKLLVPVESGYFDALRGLGVAERRQLTHMRLGNLALPGERARLIAQASYAAG